MWGWKAVERRIERSVSMEKARDTMKEEGFVEHVANPGHAIFKRAGTQLTTKGEKFSLEVVLAEDGAGLFLQARYDTFVLFDTGDLEKIAGGLAEKLGARV